ncbi:MAG: TonB-dependent receptor plug domain-containing protein [Bacteroidaceae bacterium]|nr:TonB-dependent receptor plug domain-containing protein [Bacteroidaceae bacterium]
MYILRNTKISKSIVLLFLILTTCVAQAQEETRVYDQAVEAYEFGRFEQVDSLLRDVAGTLKGETRINAYRLLALSSINMDKLEEAEGYVGKLLAADPYFKAYNDAPRFADMVESLKGGKGATITTASQQAESIEEAPVPVTLITEEMLRNIGARTLKDALLAYVPGMTDIASNEEMNIAMRGVFSSSQEKILILLNGHRLNSYSTNAATPDYSMSLEKVKQIEVLRGPASSIYGGVALTGVVNIITKDGSDVDGIKLKGTLGNYGQMQGDILFGKRYMGLDILVWGSLYASSGEKRFIEGTEEAQPYSILPCSGDMIIGGYNRKPTYDIGINLHNNTFHILYNRRFAKTVSALALSSGFTPYSYKKYLKWNGNAPGNAVASQHIELGYNDKKGAFSWQGTAFFDSQSQQRLQIVGDTVPDLEDFTTIFPYHDAPGVRMDKGGFQCVSWDEYTMGVKAMGGYEYHLGKSQHGNILLGGEYNHFTLNHSSYFEGVNYYEIIKTFHDEKELQTGEEQGADVFLQMKHIFHKSFFMNAGLRYDFKKRRLGKTLNEYSPRLAFIYNNPLFQIKMSYARSFVDAPYFYRSNTLDVEYGWEGLLPEILNSYQISFLSNGTLVKGLLLDANFFYNNASDFITYDGNLAYNAGSLKTGGIELVAKYSPKRLMTEVNFTWQTVIDQKEYYQVDGRRMFNIPPIKLNGIVSYEILKNLDLYAKANLTTEQSSAFISLFGELEMIDIPVRCLIDAGGHYRYRTLDLAFDIHNLLNHKYVQGGGSVAPMMQQGLWFTTSVAYKF